MTDLYRQALLEHYRHPHNWGLEEQATFTHKGANRLCGDHISLQLDVEDGVVKAARFEGRGCAISIAAASLVTDFIIQKTVSEVETLRIADVNQLLGMTIAPGRMSCALLALTTAQRAIRFH